MSYFEKVETAVNKIRELRGTLSDKDVIDKILMTLPINYSDKISTIEETYDPKKLTTKQLLGTLTAFEVRKFRKDKDKLKIAFKAFEDSSDDEETLDGVEANFVRKLKKGTNKYKGVLPFKCFRCGKIGHIATRCLEKGIDKSLGKQGKVE